MDFDIIQTAPEHKSGIAYTPRDGFDELRATFEEFKSANDQRLGALERKRSDVLLEEKVDRINAALDLQTKRMDDMALRHARPALEGRGKLVSDAAAAREHKSAFDAYVRSGEAGALRALEPRRCRRAPMPTVAIWCRPNSSTRSASDWRRSHRAARWPRCARFPVMELYAMPAATAALLDDAAVNIDEWIASEVELTFAVQEGAAFVNGDGSNKPKGFLASDTVANASGAWGKLGYIASGGASGFAASNPSDALVDLIYALKTGYRQNGAFVMNRKTQATIRKFKDTGGAYLWQPPAEAGGRASLMTFPLVEAEDMPDVGANSLSIAFGDFRRGYLIVDRLGVRVLRDPYSAKPYVLFYTTKRVGGGFQDFDAIKLMKFAAS